MACHDDLTAADLVGRCVFVGGQTVSMGDPFAAAAPAGAICWLDQIVEARKETLERFVAIAFDWPDPELEAAIVVRETGVPALAAESEALLERWLESEFTREPVRCMAVAIAAQVQAQHRFALDWIERVARAHVPMAQLVVRHLPAMLTRFDPRTLEDWIQPSTHARDRAGLNVVRDMLRQSGRFARLGIAQAHDTVVDGIAGVLRRFVCAFAGRVLPVEPGDAARTDGKTPYLPPVVARRARAARNFQLAKVMAPVPWALWRFGAWRVDPRARCGTHAARPGPARASSCCRRAQATRMRRRVTS